MTGIFKKFLGIVLVLAMAPLGAAGFELELSKEEKVLLTNGVGLLAITAWGVANWDYFTTLPSRGDEGWFSENTDEGGIDKLGHFHSTYALSHILGASFERWGYSHERASFLGALSSFTLMGAMEAGDSFSDFGFSYEDFIMNSLGSIAGYYFRVCPELARKIDLRVEYRPNFTEADIFTDYERTRFLAAIKLAGFDGVKNPYLKYLEIHVGYFVEGYSDNKTNRSRNIYLGVGINLPRVFKHYSLNRASTIANYLQIPFTSLRLDKDLN
ncbi:MAG: DUF2279 domain-containing protein [Desulfobacteraceae bacterium]|nr:DUF2279 domain-containing protein [Desulfobacteraceae bacterium]